MSATNMESFAFDGLETGRMQCHIDDRTLLLGQSGVRGTIMSMITATGKYVIWNQSSGGGAEIPRAILMKDADASLADVPCKIYSFGEFDENKLILGTGDVISDILRNTLAVNGIYLVKGQI